MYIGQMEVSQNFVAFSEYMNFTMYVLCRIFHSILACIHGILEDKITFIYKLIGLPTTHLFCMQIFNPSVYHYQGKEGSNQMALCSTHLAPILYSFVLLFMQLYNNLDFTDVQLNTYLCRPPAYG